MRRGLAGYFLASVALLGCANLSGLTGGHGDAASDAGLGADGTGGVCVAGRSLACTGAGGCAGGQACNATGTGYEACVCESTDGGRSDAAIPVPAEVQCQTVALEASSSTATITLGSGVGKDDTLVLAIVNYSSTIQVSSISGGEGSGGQGEWGKAVGPVSNAGETGTAEIWYVRAVAAGTTEVTITFTAPLAPFASGTSGVATLSEWTNLEGVPGPFDTATSNQGSASTAFSSSPLTPSASHELLVALAVTQRYGADLAYAPWTELGDFASTSTGYADASYLVASSTGAQTVMGTQGNGSGEGWEVLVAAFK